MTWSKLFRLERPFPQFLKKLLIESTKTLEQHISNHKIVKTTSKNKVLNSKLDIFYLQILIANAKRTLSAQKNKQSFRLLATTTFIRPADLSNTLLIKTYKDDTIHCGKSLAFLKTDSFKSNNRNNAL